MANKLKLTKKILEKNWELVPTYPSPNQCEAVNTKEDMIVFRTTRLNKTYKENIFGKFKSKIVEISVHVLINGRWKTELTDEEYNKIMRYAFVSGDEQ